MNKISVTIRGSSSKLSSSSTRGKVCLCKTVTRLVFAHNRATESDPGADKHSFLNSRVRSKHALKASYLKGFAIDHAAILRETCAQEMFLEV